MMWAWIQNKYSNKFTSEKEYLSSRSAVNKLKSFGWFEDFLSHCGRIVDFGNKQYQTRAAISNIHSVLVTLSKYTGTIPSEDMELLFYEDCKLMLPLAKSAIKKLPGGGNRCPPWVLDKSQIFPCSNCLAQHSDG